MAVTVGSIAEFEEVTSSTSGDSPSAGAVAIALAIDSDSPQAGARATLPVVAADSPQAGSQTPIPTTQGDSPQAGSETRIPTTDADSPQAGGETEAQMGNLLGKPADGSDRPANGSVGLRANGSGFSDRDEIDLLPDQPGLTVTGEDDNTPGNERGLFKLRVEGEVEVFRGDFNLALGPVGTNVVFSADASQARFLPTRVLAFAKDVSGVSVQPQFDLRKTSNGDVLTQVAMAFTATGQADEFAAAKPREAISSLEDLLFGIDTLATATTYVVEVIVLGRVVPA